MEDGWYSIILEDNNIVGELGDAVAGSPSINKSTLLAINKC